jgi:hypothetical protein
LAKVGIAAVKKVGQVNGDHKNEQQNGECISAILHHFIGKKRKAGGYKGGADYVNPKFASRHPGGYERDQILWFKKVVHTKNDKHYAQNANGSP